MVGVWVDVAVAVGVLVGVRVGVGVGVRMATTELSCFGVPLREPPAWSRPLR